MIVVGIEYRPCQTPGYVMRVIRFLQETPVIAPDGRPVYQIRSSYELVRVAERKIEA